MEWHPAWELKTNIMEARQADTEQKQRWEVAGQCRHICETPTEESFSVGHLHWTHPLEEHQVSTFFYGMEEAWG